VVRKGVEQEVRKAQSLQISHPMPRIVADAYSLFV